MIGIMADSHDHIHSLKKAVELFNNTNCNLVIHAGDYIAPFAARMLESLQCPVKGVFGNCDGEKEGLKKAFQSFGEIKEAPYIFRYDGLHFLISHLDQPVRSYSATEAHDVIIFAHTHKPEIRKEKKTLIVNPGENGGWLYGKSTVALLDAKTMTAEIIYI